MIRSLVAFIFLFAFFYCGIIAWRCATNNHKWQLTKDIAYSIMCAGLTLLVLSIIYILF